MKLLVDEAAGKRIMRTLAGQNGDIQGSIF